MALLGIALFTALMGLSRRWLCNASGLEEKPVRYYLICITVVFGLYWLPAWFAGGFVEDDWQLLAAASIRKIIYLHPSYIWYALDSVDGNFRPLGTVLYFGYMLKWFGLAPRAFTFGPLLVSLLGGMVAFAIVREMGYSKVAATVASLLFLTRGVLYTIVTWTCAFGDSISIALCGLTALFVLKANRRHGLAAILCHLLAWFFFLMATLAKQSSFVAPLIVVLLLLLRPGEPEADQGRAKLPTLTRRIATAAVTLCVYSATAAAVFLHAKSLLRVPSPYLIQFSAKALFQTFSYATWYFLVVKFPNNFRVANMLPGLMGLAIVATLIFLARRHPPLLGDRPRDIAFAGLASAASVSLFILLGTRSAPYYGCMAAFWFSIALGIALTRYGAPGPGNPAARLCCFLFCLLLLSGFIEVRIEQTGLIPSGGYPWGTFGMDTERTVQADMQRETATPGKDMLLLVDCTATIPYASMTMLDAPAIQRILMLDSHTGAYRANNHQGLRPTDDLPGLSDPQAYNWNKPMDPSIFAGIAAHESVLRLQCDKDRPKPQGSSE